MFACYMRSALMRANDVRPYVGDYFTLHAAGMNSLE